jgi:hypothetical protein
VLDARFARDLEPDDARGEVTQFLDHQDGSFRLDLGQV